MSRQQQTTSDGGTITLDATACNCDGAPNRKLDTSTDEGFREFLRLRDLPGAHYDAASGILTIPDAAPSAAPGAQLDAAALQDDDAFRAALARKVGR